MSIEIISGLESYENIRKKTAKHPVPGRDGERYVPHPTVQHTPGFSIKSTDHFFTIGSCFARNVERALVGLKLPVLSAILDELGPGENISNKYTSKSILHDLQIAFEDDSKKYATIYDLDDERAMNLSFGGLGVKSNLKNRSAVMALTDRYYDHMRSLASADVIVLTLGLVETWYDNTEGVYLNLAPPRELVKAEPERFELHVLSFDEISADIENIVKILEANTKRDFKMLITVSPVPLYATFRDQDCLQANMYSKSVLRAAVEKICTTNKKISYFPSYEMVVLSAPQVAWVEHDYRHVQPELVDRIMQSVISQYISPDLFPPSKSDIQSMIANGGYKEVVSSVETYLETYDHQISEMPPHIQWYYAKSLAVIGKKLDAEKILEMFLIKKPNHAAALVLLSKLKAR